MDPLPLPDLPELAPGSVWLVGAGPGDPGLLSLLALHALRTAEVVVYDALVDARIVGLANPAAVLEFAGKRGGKPSPSQPDISRRLVELARQGRRVLRLKGGDPFVFGRGAEEAMTLAEAGIPFRVVPGVTAGVGALAYAGIPLTARDVNSAVVFVTGHDASGELTERVDWGAVARLPVVVVYMPMAHIGRIADRLLAAGRAPDDDAAVIVRGAMPGQKVIAAPLAEIAEAARAAAVEPPAVLVVGGVVRLRGRLDWLRTEMPETASK